MNNIAKLVKQFRTSKGMTQQELELEINAASGHISKIESGKVNPTKEILLHIADVLELNQREKKHLLGIGFYFPSEKEIQSAIQEAKGYLTNTKDFTYLSDRFWFVWDVNQTVIDFLGYSHKNYEDLVPLFRGSHLLDWIFNPDLGFRKLIPPNLFKIGAQTQVSYFLKEANYEMVKSQDWMNNLLHRCKTYPDFNEVWNKSLLEIDKTISHEEKYWVFKSNGVYSKFYLSEIQLVKNTHFEIIEYILQK